MIKPTLIKEIFGQPTWHFTHNEQEYFIFLGVDEEGEPRKIHLAKPKAQGDYFVPEYLISSQAWEIKKAVSIREGIETLFLPKVNEYLASLGGDASFPVTGSDLEQYNWTIENSLSYSNGKVTLIA